MPYSVSLGCCVDTERSALVRQRRQWNQMQCNDPALRVRRLPGHVNCVRQLRLVTMLAIVACSISGLAMPGGVPFIASASGSDKSFQTVAPSCDSGVSEDAMILATRLHQAMTGNLVMDDPKLQELGRKIDLVLAQIRDRHPRMSEIFARWWYAPARLILHLEGDLLDAVIEHWQNWNGEPLPRTGHAIFDELNARIGLHGAKTYLHSSMVVVSFSKLANMRAAHEAYAAIDGVRHVEFDWFVGDGPDILAANDGETWHVAMRDAWGDCPSGCMHEETFYFIVRSGHLEQVEENEARNIRQFRELPPALE